MNASIPTAVPRQGLPKDMVGRQVHVVMGKGGVGKSTVALSLALALWREGRKVLLVQVNTPDAHGPVLGVNVGAELVKVRDRLTLVNIDPKEARREYVMLILKFRKLYDAVFENRFVTYLLRFIPSLAELNIMGKVWFHAEQEENGRRTYDAIVLDAPATGHGITLMKLSRMLVDTAPQGAMRAQVLEMAGCFEDPSRTALHVVTTPDELSVMETLELLQRLKSEKVGPIGAAFLNRVPKPLFAGLDAAALPNFAAVAAWKDVGSVAVERLRLEKSCGEARTRLQEQGLAVVELPELPSEPFGVNDATELAAKVIPPRVTVEALS